MRKHLTQEQLTDFLGRFGGMFLVALLLMLAFLLFIIACAGFILVKLVK